MTIELPDVMLGSQPLTSEQARIELACALYAQWKISTFEAVKITGLSRIQFWGELGQRKIPRQIRVEDVEHDIRVVNELLAKEAAAKETAA
jgi:predicted HTH domain antitoxin